MRDRFFIDRLFDEPRFLIFGSIVANYILDKYKDLPKPISDFYKVAAKPEGLSIIDKFIYTLVPKFRYREMESSFALNTSDTAKQFLKAIDDLLTEDKIIFYKSSGGRIRNRGEIENLLASYYPAFNNYFYPVFELTVYNNGQEDLFVKNVSVIVDSVLEYAGPTELIPESKIISILVDKKPGEYFPSINSDLVIKSGSYQKLLIRLIPKANESSYKLKFKIYASEYTIVTEQIAVDF